MSKNTLVIGASINKERYSYRVIKKLLDKNHKVFAIGKNKDKIHDIIIHPNFKFFNKIHTITLYISPKIQKNYFDYVLKLNPKRVIFNPGSENFDFANFLSKNSIKWENSCTLVLLSTNQY
jgi:predicted CoA-binding protein